MSPAAVSDLTQITNTPGIYYAVAYWLACILYIRVNKMTLRGLPFVGVQLLFFAVLGGFMVATDGIEVRFFIPCMLLDVALMLLLIRLCCEVSWQKAGYFTVRAFLLGELAASLEWQIYYYGLRYWHFPRAMWFNILFLCGAYGVIFGVMYLLERRYREGNYTLRITGKELALAVVLCVSVYAVSNLSYIYERTPFSSSFTTELFIIRTLVDFGGVGMFFAYHMQLHELGAKMERDAMENILRMQYETYRFSEESIAMVNQKYHDLKHQIRLLQLETSSEEKREFLNQMEQEIKRYELCYKTGSKVLDTILAMKSVQCESLGVSFTCVADGAELEFMRPMDISALFGNALDNAIESVEKIEDREKRLIHLSIVRQKNFLRIRLENCYEGAIAFENGRPVTTKKNKELHGYGTKSIQRIVERYHGSVTMEARDGWFELRILLPLEDGGKGTAP